MERRYFHCGKTNADIPLDVGIDALSSQRMRDLRIGVHCPCGEMHYSWVDELFRLSPDRLPPPRVASDTSGISG